MGGTPQAVWAQGRQEPKADEKKGNQEQSGHKHTSHRPEYCPDCTTERLAREAGRARKWAGDPFGSPAHFLFQSPDMQTRGINRDRRS